MKEILIYSDDGAGPRATRYLKLSLVEEGIHERYRIRRVNRFDLRTSKWCENTVLLIFPGGRSMPYHEALAGPTNRLIRAWVEQGGRYLGICAGGYYGCNKVEFEQGTPLEIVREHELRFFSGTARGPAYGTGVFRYENESGARLANLSWYGDSKIAQKELSCYYNGGCSFVDAHKMPDVHVLARYSDIQDSPAAIIECAVGKGKALLCGVHPEYAPHFLEKNDPHLSGLRQRLEKVNEGRRLLFTQMIEKVLCTN